MLHLTNGSAIIPKIREAGIAGRIVPWDDVLHEGPVPAGLNVAAMRDVRAQFIASDGGSFDEVARSFAARDAALEDLRGISEIVLWFEHDLYDQLQLIQILDRLPVDRGPLVTAVSDDDYLGTQPAARFAGLFAARRPVTSSQRIAARDAWEAFRSADPRAISDAIPRLSDLRHVGPALRRHLQQFPWLADGLSRTERQALEAVARGISAVREVYVAANHEREEAVFMGDLPFVSHIAALMRPPRPLLRVTSGATSTHDPLSTAIDDRLALTGDGERVLNGDADRVVLCGIDRWLGGVHLTGHGPVWRWDPQRQIVRTA